MISSDGIRGYNDAIILSILSKDDSYGYDISKQIREKQIRSISLRETTLYSAFTRFGKTGIDPLVSWRSDSWKETHLLSNQ